jgi:hypothetical protein
VLIARRELARRIKTITHQGGEHAPSA